ncbi:MAG: TldD/PmbA family protein [Candidatus Bilamarchaeaceae archaeon]
MRWELRAERGTTEQVSLIDDELNISSGSYSGLSARVLSGKSWGFSSASGKGADGGKLIRRAECLAKLRDGDVELAETMPVRKKFRGRQDHTPIEEIADLMKDARSRIRGKRIQSVRFAFMRETFIKEFSDSEGAEIVVPAQYSYFSCNVIARDGANIQRAGGRVGMVGSYEPGKMLRESEEAGRKAVSYLSASPAPKGRFTVVLDPEMTGVFSHEAVGHASEADAIISGESLFTGKLGKRIGNPLVSIADDPRADDYGFYELDDEGVPSERTELIRDGVLVGYLNSRETAKKLKIPLNGHCRAESYDCSPIVRMGNTYFQRGKSPRDEVFDVRSGIYVKGMRGGSVDPFTGGFMFKAEEAHEIKDGEPTRLLRDVSLSGNIMHVLNNVEAVGKDFGTSPGHCGKMGQSMPVSDGGPHIRVKDLVIG